MGQIETQLAEPGVEPAGADSRTRLLEAARALVLRGEGKFSIAVLCAEAGVARAAFRMHFPGKTALMAAMMQQDVSRSAPAAAIETAPAPETPAAMPPSEKTSEKMADAWLERRLRVFERALNALEAKAETKQRQLDLRVAQLEERLAALDQPTVQQSAPRSFADPLPAASSQPQPGSPAEPPAAPQESERKSDPTLIIPPLPVAVLSREEMAEVLQSARDKARNAVPEEPPKPTISSRLRWLGMGGLALVVLFIGIGLILGDPARATQPELMGNGAAPRHVAATSLGRTIALADAGDPRAQARLALAYLRGDGVAGDPIAAARWSAAAADAGEPTAQYLLGTQYSQGAGVSPDPHRAFSWFAVAASRGNLKAMHNLAIAYAQGLGTPRDEARAALWFGRAAERGYVDSAFDLAVLYERGQGVPQDLAQALKWYGIAAREGDVPSRARMQFLRGQLKPSDVQLAVDATQAFAPLAAPAGANVLPDF